MAHSDPLPDEVAKYLASQIAVVSRDLPTATPRPARRKGVAAVAGPPPNRELTESFAIWTLRDEAVTKPNTNLTELAHETGRWHHQVKVAGVPASFARSTPLGPAPDHWRVNAFFDSPIARKIDQAITWIDENVKNDPLVRLLVAPSYHLHAFWLVKDGVNTVVVADMPPNFKALRYEKPYSSEEFLLALSQEQHITGLTFG